MQALPVSASSMASQAVTVFDGERGQKLASWCQLTILPSPGSLQKKWAPHPTTSSPKQVADVGDDPRIVHDIVHHARLQVGGNDGVVMVTPRQDLLDHAVEFVPEWRRSPHPSRS